VSGLRDILTALVRENARFVVIGGVALQLQGSSYITDDIDLAYERTRDNARRMARALSSFEPRPRGFPDDVPFRFDDQTLMASDGQTLSTSVGDLDLLTTVKGIGMFADVDSSADAKHYWGLTVKVLSIDGLIRAKRAAGRPKDEPGIIELEALREARERLHRVGSTPASSAGTESD
jgi:predicted nucleotidyltransferase